MEIRIEAPAGEAPPPNTFVSMRVGDIQKQSRLETTRTYRFPPPQDARGTIARLEVFKRVGNISVDLDKCNSSDRLEVPCSDLDRDSIALRLDVKGLQAKAQARPVSRGQENAHEAALRRCPAVPHGLQSGRRLG